MKMLQAQRAALEAEIGTFRCHWLHLVACSHPSRCELTAHIGPHASAICMPCITLRWSNVHFLIPAYGAPQRRRQVLAASDQLHNTADMKATHQRSCAIWGPPPPPLCSPTQLQFPPFHNDWL